MNVLEGLKTLYEATGGSQEDLNGIQENNDPNMYSSIYGDGLNTTLPSNVEEGIRSIAKNGTSQSGGIIIVEPTSMTEEKITLNATYNDIISAGYAVLKIVMNSDNPNFYVYHQMLESGYIEETEEDFGYHVDFGGLGRVFYSVAESADDFLVIENSNHGNPNVS